MHVLEHPVRKAKKTPRTPRGLGGLARTDQDGNGRLLDLDQQRLEVTHQAHDARQRIVVLTQHFPLRSATTVRSPTVAAPAARR